MKSLISRIVVAVNGSEQSVHAAMYGILMAKQYKCELKAIYVVDTATLKQLTMTNFFFKEEGEKYEENLIHDGNKYLEQIKELAGAKGVKIETELRKGSPWSEILRAADETKADLILLGGKEHGSSSMNSVIHNDKASATNMDIIGNANCNVLVVRQKEIDRLFKIS